MDKVEPRKPAIASVFASFPPLVFNFTLCNMKATGLFSCLYSFRQASGTLSAAPTLASCGNNPDHYGKEMGRHFGGDMDKLCAHVAQQSAEQQKAVIDGSEALRDFLGIRNPNGFRKRFLSSGSSSSPIQDSDAPIPLAIAATRSGKDTRVLRSLTRLDEILKKNPPTHRASPVYQQRVETAFSKLLQEFHELRTEAAQQKALELIERHFSHLNPGAQADIVSLARNARGKQGISNELKNRLHKLSESGGEAKPEALLNMEESNQPERGNNRGKANFAAILRNSAFTHPQGEITNQASSSSNGAPPLSINKQKFLESDKGLPLMRRAHSAVQLSITEVSKLAKAYSQEIGSTIHVSGNVIPITAEDRKAWRVKQEKFFDNLVSDPDAGVQMLHRYFNDFRKDKALLKNFPTIFAIYQQQLDPARIQPEMKDELTKFIKANTDSIRDRLLARVKKEREELSETSKRIGYGTKRAAEELATIANNTGGVAHGYIFLARERNLISAPGQDMHVIPDRGHMESYVVSSTGKVIDVIPYWRGVGKRPELEGQYSADVKPFLIDPERMVFPQGGGIECGTMGLSYLKQYLKDNAKQLNGNTLLLDREINGMQMQFHLPSPQVLKYSQSDLYAKLVRAIVAGDKNVVTVEHKGEEIDVITLQGWLNAGAVASRPDGMEMPGGIENFRKSWLELCDISDAKRLQMQVDGRNLYTAYTSQRLEKKTVRSEAKS